VTPYTTWIRTFGGINGLDRSGAIARSFGLKSAVLIVMTDGVHDTWKSQREGPQGAYWGVSDSRVRNGYQTGALTSDDFVTALWAALNFRQDHPALSINPIANEVTKDRAIGNTALGRALLDADYSLKRLTLGVDINGDGKSYLADHRFRNARFWFCPSLYFRRAHVGATAWLVLVERAFNHSMNQRSAGPLEVEVLDNGGADLRVRSTVNGPDTNGDGIVGKRDLDLYGRQRQTEKHRLKATILDSGGARLSIKTTMR
jgi:hypothetical protein